MVHQPVGNKKTYHSVSLLFFLLIRHGCKLSSHMRLPHWTFSNTVNKMYQLFNIFLLSMVIGIIAWFTSQGNYARFISFACQLVLVVTSHFILYRRSLKHVMLFHFHAFTLLPNGTARLRSFSQCLLLIGWGYTAKTAPLHKEAISFVVRWILSKSTVLTVSLAWHIDPKAFFINVL